jgi:hypothetical protein
VASSSAPAVAEAAAAPPLPALPDWYDLRSGVVWVWVTDREAKQLRGATSLLESPKPERPPYSLRLASSLLDRARPADDLTAIVRSPSYARRRTAAPNLMGAILLREEDAFVPVRVTLDPGSLVVDLDARTARTLDGDGVPLSEVGSRAADIAAFAVRAGPMRGYQIVQAGRVASLEIATPRVLAAFDDEIALLEAFVPLLERAGPLEVPRALVALRQASVEPNAGWDARDRLEALRALRAHAGAAWRWERDPRSQPSALAGGQVPAPANPCRKLFHAGRKLDPGEWCGTGAMSFHYCSEGCSMVGEGCLPEAARFD